MTCELACALAPALPTGALLPEEQAAVEVHLAACERCRSRSGAFTDALAALREDEPPTPAERQTCERTLARVLARLETTELADGPAKPGPVDQERPIAALPIALGCTYCHDLLRREEATYCASCLAPHHDECFSGHGRCSAPGCGETHVVRPRTLPPAPRRAGRVVRLGLGLLAIGGVAAAAFAWRAERLARQADQAAVQAARADAAQARQEVARLLAQARARERQLDLSGALADYTQVLEVDPHNGQAWSARGMVYLTLGQREAALHDLSQALTYSPADPSVQRTYQVLASAADPAAVASLTDPGSEAPVSSAALLLAQVEQVHPQAGWAWVDTGRARGVQPGDAFAIRQAGRIVARLQIEELDEVHAGGPLAPLVRDLPVRPGDQAERVADPAVWERARRQNLAHQALGRLVERAQANGLPPLRVLYLDRFPRWEQRHLERLLVSTPSLAARSLVLGADTGRPGAATPGLTPLAAVPDRLVDVDVLVLGEVPEELIPDRALEELLSRGGGLVLLANPDGLTPPDLRPRSPLRTIATAPVVARDFVAQAGLTGLREVLRAGDIALPPLQEVWPGELTEGALGLLQDGHERPVLALRRAGQGRVVQVGAADTWRWRQTQEDAWAAFWLEAIELAGGR